MQTEDMKHIYWIVGTLVVANVGTIVSVWVFSIKATFKVTAWIKDTEHSISNAKDTAVRAHKRIDTLEAKL